MPRTKKVSESSSERKIRPAISPEARENQLIALAYDLVEKRLKEGTATSQETTSLIRLGTAKARLEAEKLRRENQLLTVKAESIESSEKSEKLYADAIAAMRKYSGNYEEIEE